MAKTKKPTSAKLNKEIWKLCRAIVRIIYPNVCYTCGAPNLEGSNWQTGHLIPKSVCNVFLKYDLRILRPQCLSCNCHRGGMGAEFIRNMIIREGQKYVDSIYEDKLKKTLCGKDAYSYYEMLLEKYKIILEDLNSAKEIH